MPFDIEAEIASRLNVSRDAIGPVLDTVIERIRQQVSHYGYARVAGLGTFRGQDGEIAFEPDPVLADEVNLRFAGLESVSVMAGGEEEWEEEGEEEEDGEWDEEGDELADFDGDEEEVVYGDSPGDDYERGEPGTSDEEEFDEDDGVDESEDLFTDLPEQDEDVAPWEGDVADEAPSTQQEPFPWDEDNGGAPQPTVGDTFGVSWTDEDEDLVEDTAEDDWEAGRDEVDLDEIEEADTWLAQREENDALGTVPETPFEEADYSVLEDNIDRSQEDIDDEETRFAGDDLEEEFEGDFQTSDTFEDEYAFEDADADEFGTESRDVQDADEFGTELNDIPDTDEGIGDGPTVEWSPHDEPSDEDRFADEEAVVAAAGAGAAFDDDEDHDEHAAHEKAPDRGALPHERIRQHPPRRHAAAAATGRGAAGGSRSAVWFGVGIIILVAAIGIAYFVMIPTSTDEPVVTQQPGTPLPADTAAGAASAADTAEASASAMDDTRADADVSPAAPPPVQEDVDSTPLRSADGIDPSAGGYTIVVYSDRSRSGAEDVAAGYRDDGFRTSVLENQENGATRYRVGIGQFSTLDEASGARDDLAGGELPEDAWVRRVQ